MRLVRGPLGTLALAALLAVVSVAPAWAHPIEIPKILQEVDGAWPETIRPSTDVVVPMLVTVSADGSVSEPTVDVSLGPLLDAAAVRAALQWRFEPARKDGAAIPSRARIAVRFRGPPDAEVAFFDLGAAGVADAGAAVDGGSAPAPLATLGADAGVPDATGDGGAELDADFGAVARAERPARSASEVVRERDVLSAAPHRTGSDMLLVVPGLFVTQHSGEGKAHQIFYRGFDAVHGQDVEIWVGGAPVNEVSNIHGQGYADVHFVIPEVVRSLRASPGTYDPRQGDFAVAGTMRFDLGLDQPGLIAKAGYGSFGASRYLLAYRPKNASESTFAAAEFYDTDGFGPSRAARRASAIAQGTWRIARATQGRVLWTGYTGHFDSAGVLRLSDIESGAVSRFATYDPTQGGASMRSQLVAELKHESSAASFAIAPYLVLRTLRLRQNFTGYLLDEDGDSTQQLNDALTLGGTAFYRMKKRLFSSADSFEIGVTARSDWVEQSQKRLARVDQSVTVDEVDARVRAFDVGSYFDAALHPWRMLTLRGGVRIDGLGYLSQDNGARAAGQTRASQGAHYGGKATLELHLLPGFGLLGSYGDGFRSPQARSLAESETTPFTKVRSAEVGVRYAQRQLAASAAGFRTWLSDDLVFDPATVRNEAVPATQRTGFSVDGTYKPLSWLNLTLNVTYTRAEFRESADGYQRGDLVPYAPQLVSRGDFAASPVFGEWKRRKLRGDFGAGVSYLARRPLPYSLFGHDIFLLDVQAGLRWGEVGLSLKAFNLLDAHWYDGEFLYASKWDQDQGASLVPLRHVTVGAPRTLLATLEIYL